MSVIARLHAGRLAAGRARRLRAAGAGCTRRSFRPSPAKALCRWRSLQFSARRDAVDRQLRVAQVLLHVPRMRSFKRFALRDRGLLPAQLHQRQPHQLLDQFARAARRRLAHVRQFQVGVAHGLQRHARDAAAAQPARQHAVERQAGVASWPSLGTITIRWSTRSGLATMCSAGGVVDHPGAVAHAGLAALLRAPPRCPARARRSSGSRVAGARHLRRCAARGAGWLRAASGSRRPHGSRRHLAVEFGVAVQVRLQAAEVA
jgi:hypothetical protein